MGRATRLFFALVIVALCATASAIYSRPMDGLSVAWFIILGLISATAAVGSVSELIGQVARSQLRTTLDGFFWVVFVVLPISATLCASAVWTLAWYFLSWD